MEPQMEPIAGADVPPPIPTDEPNSPRSTSETPSLAIAGVTKAVCQHCGKSRTWTTTPLEACPDCGGTLTITAATGQTVAEAIARASAQLPPEKTERAPFQPGIPGLRPAFDHAAATTMLFECYDELDRETEKLLRRREDFKAQEKIVTAIGEKRDRMVRELRTRARENPYTIPAAAASSPDPKLGFIPCKFEEETGIACRICGEAGHHRTDADHSLTHLASAAIVAATNNELPAHALRRLISLIADRVVDVETVEAWPLEDKQLVASWLESITCAPAGEQPLTPMPAFLYTEADRQALEIVDELNAPEPARPPMRRHKSKATTSHLKQAADRGHKKGRGKARRRR